MSKLLIDSRPVARKEYKCDAAEWYLKNSGGKEDFEPEDWAKIQSAAAEHFKIQQGQQYVYQAGICEGEFCTFKAKIDMHEICLKYDMYAE